ncbi:dihydrodipicolinate reductase [Pelagivirga sediminicola]|uniref:Dihydrodipicolinate reductase n=1 Tax=Pelagivirga sediminicola TaxID=2170575 RepID=A0A2T7G6F2_9RHOB|nr:dihydrodipicolinate reductase [Pelagivirga sediminicola]PVA10000.1 dihydrodipicolinate reductase [Pelagivirga sediminicola]
MRHILLIACLLMPGALAPAAAMAQTFQTVASRAEFVQLISGRHLTRLGIKVGVSPEGGISGRAFGYPVTGAWERKGAYFCRDLYWGSDNLGANCQIVRISGSTIRFISDRGTGEFADLTLK